MKILCTHCRSDLKVKNGYVYGKQRYKCKACGRGYIEDDLWENITKINDGECANGI